MNRNNTEDLEQRISKLYEMVEKEINEGIKAANTDLGGHYFGNCQALEISNIEYLVDTLTNPNNEESDE